ncbi:MAG: DNA-directed RNA polymerase subunit beta [bacterium]|nr:DNA-directed RNA polymerase subunit beta [bacterium]
MIKSYQKIKEIKTLPNLIEAQLSSFNDFLQLDIPPSKREPKGLQSAFLEAFPVEDAHQQYRLEFRSYNIGTPDYSPDMAIERGVSYEAPLRGEFRLITRESDSTTKEAIEQDVYLGQLPLMTDRGTFIINGVERVVVSQLRRSPGIYFSEEIHPSGKRLFIGEIIPYRGPWITFSTDVNDVLHVALDKRHKILCTTLLKALGYNTTEQILKLFFKSITRPLNESIGFILSSPVKDNKRNVLLARAGTRVDQELISSLESFRVKNVEVLEDKEPPFILNTLAKERIENQSDALLRIYSLLRGTAIQDRAIAETFFNTMYFNELRYNFARIGRHRINRKFGTKIESLALSPEDFVNTIRGIIALSRGEETVNDPEHLGNRHLRRVGELLEEQFRIAFARLTWVIKERMMLRDSEILTPRGLMNATIVTTVLQKFFGTSQLSQFMEQTNPLAELTHRRRISRLGPGGLTRDTAGLEARDVHYSHYGRICPIETSEGQNIGIITSLASYANVNEYGEIEVPYRRVRNGRVTNEIEYLTADEEDKYIIAQANTQVDEDGKFTQSLILARKRGSFPIVSPKDVNYMDVSPKQLVSVTAALIPFLEHDDANRALMGSNMQRQAVPLLFPESPIVRTGIEEKVARDSGVLVIAKRSGRVVKAEASGILIKPDGDKFSLDYYPLIKFRRTNQDTCINQRPIVKVGDKIKNGQVIADGASTEHGKIALGRNVIVAFMPWRGYNFEDAIIISESLLRDDVFTSVTIQEFEIEVRDTALGPEEVTRDVPNVPDEAVANLDESGIVRVGASVDVDDILVGKISPKGEKELSPEEKLLQAIFGEKAQDVKDSSLRVPPGVKGKVIDVRILSRRSEDQLYKQEMKRRTNEIKARTKYLIKELKKQARLAESRRGSIKTEVLSKHIRELKAKEQIEIDKATRGDELPHGVLKIIKVYIGERRSVAIGDKLSGRHGNKGTIAKIIPEEDMPYLPDGTHVEIVLNPLSVPSRMNIGQILETNLGWAAKILGFEAVSPVFDGVTVEEIKKELCKARLAEDGKTVLFDGRTGELFKERVTVGYIYMMKLGHMVEDKIHARSVGSYALITQQPLGGKTQFGGQRFGEMEVWALEAYGAAHTLQEMLTIKSDDVTGRKDLYESIIKGDKFPEPGIPTSFNVLLKELNALCLDMELVKEENVRKIV